MPDMTFIAALKAVLDTPGIFPCRKLEVSELKALTPSDKLDLAEYLEGAGYKITNKAELVMLANRPA